MPVPLNDRGARALLLVALSSEVCLRNFSAVDTPSNITGLPAGRPLLSEASTQVVSAKVASGSASEPDFA